MDTQSNVINFGAMDYPVGHPLYGQEHPQKKFLASNADLTIYGGSRGGGKTYALLLAAMRHIQHPRYAALLFRREYGEIHQENGMWDTSETIYPYAGGTGVVGSSMWTFPSGATVKMNHMANPNDWQKWLGSQLPFIGFDQLETFEAKQFWTMLACLRDPAGICNPYIMATCNPEPGWLADFLQFWWDEDTGYPIMERSGRIRWFVRIAEVIKWSDTKEALLKKYPGSFPKSVCFIPAFVEDNPLLLQINPEYISNLLAQGVVERERWHKGNWKIKATAGTIFNRAWFANKIISKAQFAEMFSTEPIRKVRAWDMAASPVSEDESSDPDWTAGCQMGTGTIHQQKKFFVIDMKHFRKTPKENQDEVKLTAQLDGLETPIRMEKEGGSAGITVVDYYKREVLGEYNFSGIGVHKKKVVRWQGLSNCLQAGNLYLVQGDWNSDFIDELDQCRGEDEKNDQADAASLAFADLKEGGGMATVVDQRTTGSDRVNLPRYSRRSMVG